MIRNIIGFEHSPELVIVNGTPTYITNGNTYRDKTLHRVTLDYICFIDVMAEQSPSFIPSPNNSIPVARVINDSDDDEYTYLRYKRNRKQTVRAGGCRHYKKKNTQMRVRGIDAKQVCITDNAETQCIHSVAYYKRMEEMSDMDKYYESEFFNMIAEYRASDCYDSFEY